MQHPWIPARGTCRRQGSVEFDMCHWSEESRSSSRTSSKWSSCSKTCSGCSYSIWTCLSSLRQILCFGLRSPQSPLCPLMTVQQTTTSVQRLRRNRRTTTSKQANCWGKCYIVICVKVKEIFIDFYCRILHIHLFGVTPVNHSSFDLLL